MIKTPIKTGIVLLALALLSACANHERAERVAADAPQCLHTETLTCDRFAGENYNCTCQRGDSLGNMLDAYRDPDY